MNAISVNTDLPVKQANWAASVDAHAQTVLSLPQVQSGAVESAQALSWLTSVAKLHPPQQIERLIRQAGGLDAHEIRALVANERQAYYPPLGVNEIYASKWLQTLPLPDGPDIAQDKMVNTLCRQILQTHYGLIPNLADEIRMSDCLTGSSHHPWMRSSPTLLGSDGRSTFLYDTHINRVDTTGDADAIRLHYHDLVANSREVASNGLFGANITIDTGLLNNLLAMASISQTALKAVLTLTDEMVQNGAEHIHFTAVPVNKDPEQYKEILLTGNLHWHNLLNGIAPTIKVDPPATLSADNKAIYIGKAQQMMVAGQIADAAKAAKDLSRADFITSIAHMGFTHNMQSPYLGASVRAYDKLDAEAAGVYLSHELNIDPRHFREVVVNTTQMQADNAQGAVQPLPHYQSLGEVNKQKLQTIAESINLDLSPFITRQMRSYTSGQSRGAVSDTLKAVKQAAQDELSVIQTQLMQRDEVHSPILFTDVVGSVVNSAINRTGNRVVKKADTEINTPIPDTQSMAV
jgi:hypothetical protein